MPSTSENALFDKIKLKKKAGSFRDPERYRMLNITAREMIRIKDFVFRERRHDNRYQLKASKSEANGLKYYKRMDPLKDAIKARHPVVWPDNSPTFDGKDYDYWLEDLIIACRHETLRPNSALTDIRTARQHEWHPRVKGYAGLPTASKPPSSYRGVTFRKYRVLIVKNVTTNSEFLIRL